MSMHNFNLYFLLHTEIKIEYSITLNLFKNDKNNHTYACFIYKLQKYLLLNYKTIHTEILLFKLA